MYLLIGFERIHKCWITICRTKITISHTDTLNWEYAECKTTGKMGTSIRRVDSKPHSQIMFTHWNIIINPLLFTRNQGQTFLHPAKNKEWNPYTAPPFFML